jgi:hypothetical protein
LRPKLLDLFCGGGGAARGYQLAGFHVTGVDHRQQPHYCGDAFVLADALEFVAQHGREYDAVHASPPCQAYSRATAWRGDRSQHPDLIAATRVALASAGRPFVIENVQDARGLLRHPVMLCGTALGLPFRRHRYFELSGCGLLLAPPCQHRRADYSFDHGRKQTEAAYRDALGCGWMTVHEARQAIPPAFTEWVGRQLLAALGRE